MLHVWSADWLLQDKGVQLGAHVLKKAALSHPNLRYFSRSGGVEKQSLKHHRKC